MTGITPFDTIIRTAGGYTLPRCLHVVANLGVADALDETPKTAAELAAAVRANPDALGRVLRLLAAHGIFEARDGRFSHSAASRLLRSDHPQSLRALVQMLGFPVTWATFEKLEESVRTGAPAAADVGPGGFWDYFRSHPEEARIFDAAMTGKAYGQVAAVTGGYDFSPFRVIGDIGGGRGHLLRAVLEKTPGARGVMFDLPHVIDAAAAAGPVPDRLELRAGDFFKDALPVCDAYLVMEVIHDWGDEESVAILSAIRRAAPRHARLLLIEQLVPEDARPHWSQMLDILMLTLLGGRQRTRSEYETLLGRAGFRLERTIDVGSDISIVEATPARMA